MARAAQGQDARRAGGDPRRAPARGVRLRPRGEPPHDRAAPLRRPADRRHRAARGQDRGDGDRRGQDARRDLPDLPERARRPRRLHRHRQRLPRAPRRASGWARSTSTSASPSAASSPRWIRGRASPSTRADITYGTNNEFGFDYLRDNMKSRADMQVQKNLHYAIVDEVDSILIDEARTPLIISGNPEQSNRKYYVADGVARRLVKDKHFEVKEKEHTVVLTEEGIEEAQKLVGVADLLRRPAHGLAAPHRAGAARPQPLHDRQGVREAAGRGRRAGDRHRRRVHRPHDARAPLVATACTRRSRPRKASASARRTRRSRPSPSRTTSSSTGSSPA